MDDIRHRHLGYTLVELLVAIAIIGILATIVLIALRSGTQTQKARDSKRKGDLSKIQRCLEEYNNDHGFYVPENQFFCGSSALDPCMPSIPCDPYTKQPYYYQTDGATQPAWYKIFTNLEYTGDTAIASVGCSTGCPAGTSTYNYYVASSNAPASVALCSGAVAPICGQPQSYIDMCASCCPGTGYRLKKIVSSYYCCPDSTCPQ